MARIQVQYEHYAQIYIVKSNHFVFFIILQDITLCRIGQRLLES